MANIRKSFNFRTGLQVDNDNFVVNANGLVGIGTSIPQNYLLNVHGDSRITGLVTTSELYAETANALILGATNANVSGILTATQLQIGASPAVNNLIGYAYTAWITLDAGVGLHTLSRIGIGTDSTPSEQLRVIGDVAITDDVSIETGNLTLSSGDINAPSGIITAVSFDGNLNASDLTVGTVDNARLPVAISVTSITASTVGTTTVTATTVNATDVNATTVTGDLIGNADTASNLVGDPSITVTSVGTTNLNASGIVTALIELNVGTDGTALTLLNSGRLGIGTALPTSEIQVRKSSGSLAEVVSDSGEARISIGNSVGAGNSSALLRFGNSDGVLDIVNNDVGDVNTILHGGTGTGSTGNFKWIYGQTNAEMMTLTYDGNLGIANTIPSQKLSVGGGVTVTGNVHVDSDLIVDGNITGTITYPSVISGTNLNNTSGITTLDQLTVTTNVDFGDTTLVALGNTVAIGTDSGFADHGLTVQNGLRANSITVVDGIDVNAGYVTSFSTRSNGGFSSGVGTEFVRITYASSPHRVIFDVVGIGSTSLLLL